MRGLNTKTKEKWKQILLTILLFCLTLVLINSVRKVFIKKRLAEQTLSKMQLEMQTLEARKESLQNLESRLATKDGLEFELRKKFDVARPGESVAIVVEAEEDLSPQTNFSSYFQKLQNFVKNLFKFK